MNKHTFKNIMWGIVLLLAAVGLILWKLGNPVLSIFEGLAIWQIILGVAFVISLIDCIIEFNYVGIFFILAFLGMVFSKQLHIEALVPWTLLLAALLASVAFGLIFGNKRSRYAKFRKFDSKHNQDHISGVNETVEGERIFEKVSFGGATKYIRSENFQYAVLDASFGGMEVYFDKAQVPSNNCTIEIHSKFSGIEIYIPHEWRIENGISCFAGGVDIDKAWNEDYGPVTVSLKGENQFGGIEIHRV